MFDLILRGDLVLPEGVLKDGWVAVTGEVISAVGVDEIPPANRTIDARGKLVFPGAIDGQVHAGSAAGIEGLADASVAAAAGGVTTIVDMPFDEPYPINTVERLGQKIDAVERLARVDVALYATPQKGMRAAGIAELARAGACAFKVSTYEYHPDRFPGFDSGELLEIFPAIRDTGLSVAFHNEDPYIVRRLSEKLVAQRHNTPDSHGASRPPIAEYVANVSVFEIARVTGVRCHIVHSSLARGFDHVAQYRAQGLQVSAETCVQYLVFCEEDVLSLGPPLKQNPPIRSAEERALLWDKLIADEIDFVSSDHVAWPLASKSNPDMFKNNSGVPGLETILPALYTGMVVERGLDPSRVAALLCERPARHFGLYPKKGAIVPRADADFAIVDRGDWTMEQSQMASHVKWSPYHGRTFGGRVVQTILRGVSIFENGEISTQPAGGRFLRPG